MHGYGHKDRRSSRYSSDDSDSDCDAQNEHKLSRLVGDVAELAVQPFEIATKMVLNPFGLFSSPPKPKGKKSRQGRHEDAYYGGNGKQHHSMQKRPYQSEPGMQYQDKNMAPQVSPDHDNWNPSYGSGSGRAVATKSSEYSQATRLSCGNNKGGQGIKAV